MSASFVRVARVDEIQGPGPHAVSAGDVDVVLVRAASGLKAFEGRCPHRGALLGEGELQGRTLVCRNHRWRFDAETGERDGGSQCLAACEVREENGEILVDISTLTRAKAGDKKVARQIRELPGPTKLPLLGTAHLLEPERLHLQLEAWGREFGTPFVYGFGPRPVVVFSDMDEMMPVFRDRPERFRRASNLAPIFKELGVEGVFSAEGAAWRPQRRLSMEALSHKHLRGFYPTLGRVAGRLHKRWARAVERGDVLDLAEELKRFTVDVTTELVFGYDIDTLGKDSDVIQDKLSLLFPTFNRRLFSIIPWWRLIRLPTDRKVDRVVAELRAWLFGLVEDARARLAADSTRAGHPANFLEAMLTARDEKGEPFSDDAIFGNAMTMLLAGEDTTAYTLAWAVHHLLESPMDVMALRSELRNVLGDTDVPKDLETANRLSYAGGIANETMRLRPVAPVFFLEPLEDTIIGDVQIPKGTLITLMIRPPATSAAHFDTPEMFRPARWVGSGTNGVAHDPGAHQPFGSGPRICPGRTLALLEMKLVLATLYQSFDVERVGDAEGVTEAFSFTMMPVGLRVRLHRRDTFYAGDAAQI